MIFLLNCTGLPLYALYGGVGFGAGQLLKQFNLKRIAERDLAIWDYVNRHPEDFTEISMSTQSLLCSDRNKENKM